MSEYKLSVIIPTKNRNFYCCSVVQQVIDVTTDITEIVVQDNSDTDELREKLEKLHCDRLKYNYEPRQLSFVDNFSAAVSIANGDYLCMIGDDDGVLPGIENTVDYAEQNELDAVIPGLNSVYIWPYSKPIVKGAENGYLVLSYINNNTKPAYPREELKELLKNGCQDYQSFDIPRLYHGIVSKKIVNAVKEKTGNYFGGLTPDIYMAVALACLCKKVERLQFPVTISGICPRSGSAASATGAHTGELSQAPHFKGHESYTWSEQIPAIYTVETIWAETAMHALAESGEEKLCGEFSLLTLYSRLWLQYPQFRSRIVEEGKKNKISEGQIVSYALCYKAIRFSRRIVRRVKRRRGEVVKYYNVPDINAAAEKTREHVLKKCIERK